jgi:fibronectin-binding autotransporter adhesin
MKNSLSFFLKVLALLFATQDSGVASGIVTTLADWELRAALAGGGLVTFAVSGTITLTNTITITNDATLDGAFQTVTISGGETTRVFQVNFNGQLTLRNLTVEKGRAEQGAGIYNAGGIVTVTNSTFRNNQAVGSPGTGGAFPGPGQPGTGGGIYNLGSLFVFDSFFVGNLAAGGPGGSPSNVPEGNGNTGGTGSGGAIYNAGILGITNGTFNANAAHGGNGGNASGSGRSPGAGGNAFGGAIYMQAGTLGGSNCYFSDNVASAGVGPVYFGRSAGYRGQGRGGAFFNSTSTVAMVSATITNSVANGSPASGGGIHQEAGTLSLANVALANNTASASQYTIGITSSGPPGSGGGLHTTAITTLTDCSISSNTVSGGFGTSGVGSGTSNGGDAKGGGIYNSGNIAVRRCTVNGNSSTGGAGAGGFAGGVSYGGGLMNEGSAAWENSTVVFNTVTGGAGAGSAGGGIYNGGAITNGTFFGNRANGGSSGNLAGGALINTILAGGIPDNGGFVNLGNNVVTPYNPQLGPLGNYGGLTPTMPLLQGSPALDAANNLAAPTMDQRGRVRPYGGISDIGAFESSPPYVVAGRFTGLSPADSIGIILEGQTINVPHDTRFRFDDLTAGIHTMTVSNFNLAVFPNPRGLNLGPDVLDANFVAINSNSVALVDRSNNVPHVIFAGANGQSHRFLASSNLVDWFAISTNLVGPRLYSEVYDTGATSQLWRSYRSSTP